MKRRAQLVYRGTNTSANFTTVCALTSTTALVVTQSAFTATARAAQFFLTTFYGSPILLGFAKGGASVGQSVAVTLTGALDGYSGLRPGSPYYARYDGGLDTAVNEGGGVSSVLAGRAIATDMLLSMVCALALVCAAAIAVLPV